MSALKNKIILGNVKQLLVDNDLKNRGLMLEKGASEKDLITDLGKAIAGRIVLHEAVGGFYENTKYKIDPVNAPTANLITDVFEGWAFLVSMKIAARMGWSLKPEFSLGDMTMECGSFSQTASAIVNGMSDTVLNADAIAYPIEDTGDGNFYIMGDMFLKELIVEVYYET